MTTLDIAVEVSESLKWTWQDMSSEDKGNYYKRNENKEGKERKTRHLKIFVLSRFELRTGVSNC